MAPRNNRLLTCAAAAGGLLLLAVVVFTLWPSDPTDYPPTSGREQADGETVGWVSKVEDNTIHVNSGPFGSGVVPLVVTRNTRIIVGSKEGWFEDIRPGGQVKVAYEVSHGKRLARTVEVLVDEGPRRPVRAEPRLKSAAGGVTAERVPTKANASSPARDVRSTPTPTAPEPAPAPAPAVTWTPTPAAKQAIPIKPLPPPDTRTAASKPEPARVQAVETPGPPPTPTRSTGPGSGTRAQEPAARPPGAAPAAPGAAGRSVEPARTPDSGETTDGSAAVDWLLKGRR